MDAWQTLTSLPTRQLINSSTCQLKEMKLHIFNPEHDIALAANQPRFTAPHAGRQLRADLSFLPALWADDGDMVLVDDVEAALEWVRHVKRYAHDVAFVTLGDLKHISPDMRHDLQIAPWGWDRTIKEQLLRADPSLEPLLPTDERLVAIRDMSSRRFAAEHLLPLLHDANPGVVGESRYCATEDEALAAMQQYGRSVVKSPWSSSGRGVRYVAQPIPDNHLLGWMRGVLRLQGGIMVEPLYNKVYDFGMEFMANADGTINYLGLSLFDTRGGAYTASICATEKDKRKMLSRYVDMQLLDSICQQIQSTIAPLMHGIYTGPFGIDMMAVARTDGDGFWLHPCVELNLRRTMGHVALALTPTIHEPRRLMSIYYADKYRLRIQQSSENLLNTGLA